MKRNSRGLLDDLKTSLEENQEIAPVLGAVAGAILATATERYGA